MNASRMRRGDVSVGHTLAGGELNDRRGSSGSERPVEAQGHYAQFGRVRKHRDTIVSATRFAVAAGLTIASFLSIAAGH